MNDYVDFLTAVHEFSIMPLQRRFSPWQLTWTMIIHLFPIKFFKKMFNIAPLKFFSDKDDETSIRQQFPTWIGNLIYDDNRPHLLSDEYLGWLEQHAQDGVTAQQLDNILSFGDIIRKKWESRRLVEFRTIEIFINVVSNFIFIFYVIFATVLLDALHSANYEASSFIIGFYLVINFICLIVAKKQVLIQN